MHTIKQILEQVDRVKPNAFSPETKLVWIAELDGKIALNVMLMDRAELDAFHYQYPDSLDKEPLVPFPHNVLYEKWLIAQIDAANEEWNRYANDIEIYNSYYKDFVRWFASTYQPAQGGMERCGTYPRYFLTAYGLAVQQGFPGSLQEWLLSLRGDPGATPQKGVDYYTEKELEEMLDRFSDRVPKDWFASGKEIPEEADLDGYREPGKFYAANAAVASTLKNCPTDADFTLWVFDRVSDNRKNHMLIDGENRMFFRSENAGGWKEWVGWAAVDESLSKKGFAADALAVKQALGKLRASDVGARADTWTPTAAEVGARPSDWMPTATDVGARPSDWMPTAADVGAVVIKTLWANASLGSEFPPQTISLDLTGCDYIAVQTIYSISDPTGMATAFIPTIPRYGAYCTNFGIGEESWAHARHISIGTNSVTFGSGNQMQVNTGSMFPNWNDRAIPYKIFGIKGVQ